MIESNPDFYITYASDFNDAVQLMADRDRYNKVRGKTIYIILTPDADWRRERLDSNNDELKIIKSFRMHEIRESIAARKIGRVGLNLIVGTAISRIRSGAKSFKVFVSLGMDEANQLSNELNAIFDALKLPDGFIAATVDPIAEGLETFDSKIANAWTAQLDFQQ